MCLIFFKVYRIKLNEVYFSSEIVITHFLDKPCQEINFKSHLNSVLLCKWLKNTVRFAHVPCDFISLNLIVLKFIMRLESANYKSHWNILVFYNQLKIMSDLNMSHRKMYDFVSISLFGFSLVMKLIYFNVFW